jgi:quercetin dioxygenase-like cupin family protein
MNRIVATLTIGFAAAVAGGMTAHQALSAQPYALQPAVLLKTDLPDIEGKDAVLVTVTVGPGVDSGKHYHPGNELAYVLEGSMVLEVDGKPPVTLKAGETFHVPPNVAHSSRNASTTAPLKVLVFGLFDTGKPHTVAVK